MNLAIDLDGTLAAWGRVGHSVGDWLPGAAEALRRFQLAEHRVLVHSCRATWELGGGTKEIERFLLMEGFVPRLVIGREQSPSDQGVWVHATYFDRLDSAVGEVGIWVGVGKPIAHLYLDDRGWTFDPELGWEKTADLILEQAALLG